MAEHGPAVTAGSIKEQLRRDAAELRQRRVINSDEYEALLFKINSGWVNSEETLVKEIHNIINPFISEWSGAERKESFALAEEVLTEMELPLIGHSNLTENDWKGEERFGRRMATNVLEFLGNFASREFMSGPFDAPTGARDEFFDWKMTFVRSLLSARHITESEYRRLIQDDELFDSDKSMDDIMDILSDEYRVSDANIELTLRESTTAVFRRKNREMAAREEAAELADQEATLLSDDDRITSKASFERLEEDFPDKYMLNTENGLIYLTGTGELVDSSGDRIEPDPETGEYDDEIAIDDLFWNTAAATRTPWEEMEIGEDDYYTLLDVVENPERYHMGGVQRFTDGGQFIGGFGSDYNVPQALEVQQQQALETYGEVGSEQRSWMNRLGMVPPGDELNQEVRRPWYDPGDNWSLFAGMSPEFIAAEQRKLVELGALESADVIEGIWGEAEGEVMERMMARANFSAERIEDIPTEVWTKFWDDQNDSASTRRGFVPPAYRKLDLARAELTVEEAIRRSTGRDASSDELADLGQIMLDLHRQSFVADVSAARGEYAAVGQAIETGGEVGVGAVEEVDWEARFTQAVQERLGTEIDQWDRTQDVAQRQQLIGGAMSNFMQQLGGGIGGGAGIGGQ